ncbi:hypothetical protein A7P85_04380 [Eikenella corrodens]|uniref:Uncharacterized protein n=1 Tax=Eikenella corrodens TaxID=539 RepID=A0A1A9RFN7_EIKCO|nr:hypothetical protein [Eikenella corrodens]OAM17008.1 hypothetical protein A7P85_04380 [Eikenella corrodens]
MYQSVEAALSHAYRLSCMRIEPLNNTAQICHWVEDKGVSRGGGQGMTQHDWHANSAMIRARVERILSHLELCAVEAQYGSNLSRIVDLSSYILDQQQGIPLLLCDALLSHIFSGSPKQMEIQDRFDIGRVTLWRKKKQVGGIVAGLLNSAICKLEPEFRQAGIIG